MNKLNYSQIIDLEKIAVHKMIVQLQTQLICPITHMLMKDPVITEDGHSYQKLAIMQWLTHSSKSPKTGLYLQSKKLVPNLALKNISQQFKQLIDQLNLKDQIFTTKFQQLIQQNIKQNQNLLNTILNRYKIQGRVQMNSQIPLIAEMEFQNMKKKVVQTIQQHIRRVKIQYQKFKSLQKEIDLNSYQLNNKQQKSVNQISLFQDRTNVYRIQGNSVNELQNNNFNVPQLFHHFQYIAQTFPTQKQIKARFQKSDFTGLISLHHQRTYLDMQKFLKYDWSSLQFINFMDCQIDDEKWRLLVDHSYNFPYLKELRIYSNYIRTVKKGDLQRFPSLQKVMFYTYGGWNNPLVQESKQVLRQYKGNNPFVQVMFQFNV